jgi:DNA-binding transcriptional LysR family regulator
MFDLRRIRVFYEVAERRSFSSAATALDYTQSSISHHVLALERELGQRLINRGTRPISLTPAGEVLHRAAAVALAELSRADLELRSLRDGESGRLVLGSVVAGLRTVVTPAALNFRSRFPEVELVLKESNPGGVLVDLRSGRIDIGLTVTGDRLPALDLSVFATKPLLGLPLMVAVASNHRVARQSYVQLSTLRNERWVMPSSTRFPEFRAQTEELLAAAGVRPREALDTTDDLAAAQLVAAGAAVGLILDIARPGVPGVALVPVRPPLKRELVAVVLTGVQPAPVRALLDELRAAAAAHRSDR